MTIKSGIIRRQSFTGKEPGYDLRSTTVGGPIRTPDPAAVTHFKQILAEQIASKQAAAQRKKEKVVNIHLEETKPLVEAILPEAKAVIEAATDTAEIIDNSASQQFHEERTDLRDPKPITIQQATAKRPRKTRKLLSDDEAKAAHKEFWSSDETVAAVAKRWNVTNSTLTGRWQKLGLATPGKGANQHKRKAAAAIPAKAAKAATAVVPVTAPMPQALALAAPPTEPAAAAFIPADLKSRLAAFQQEMAAIGVPVNITMSLHLSKDIQL